MYQAGFRQFTLAVGIAQPLRLFVAGGANDLRALGNIEQVLIWMLMAKRTGARRDLNGESTHVFVRDHQMMVGLVGNVDDLTAIVKRTHGRFIFLLKSSRRHVIQFSGTSSLFEARHVA